MTHPVDIAALAEALLSATSPVEALRAWAEAVAPRGDVVAAIDPLTLRVEPALRAASDGGWTPVALPPIPLDHLPDRASRHRLVSGRRDVLDDLFATLGLGELLTLPLEPAGAGALVIARTGEPFGADEETALGARALLLGSSLAALARRRRREAGVAGAAQEVAVLFELTRELSRAVSALPAARSVAEALQRVLGAPAGAVLATVNTDEPAAVLAWPEGAGGRAAATRAAQFAGVPAAPPAFADRRGGSPVDPLALTWTVPAPGDGRTAIVLGWASTPPDAVARIVAAAQAALTLALDRLSTQQRREDDRLYSVFEGLPLGVALLVGAGRVRLVNHAGQRLLDAIGAQLHPDGMLERLGALELAPLVREAHGRGEAAADLFVPDGGRSFSVRVVPAAADAGTASLLLLEDVTDARRRQAQLAHAEKLSALGVFVSGIVHEINNPLGTVIGYAQMLARSPDNEARGRWLATLEEEAHRCRRIVADLLGFARPGESRRALLSLGPIAEKALALATVGFRNAKIDASLRVREPLPAVDGEPDAMLQVFINLLTNALHALENHDGRREVAVEVGQCDAATIEIVVADSGPGVPPEVLSRIFDPFFTTKGEGKGTGLGLALVDTTVRDHGGTIDVDNAPGSGARFVVRLPVAGARKPAGVAAPHAAATKVAPLAGLAGVRVLVVDDEPSLAAIMAEALGEAGAVAHIAHDGRDALDSLALHPADVIVCDIEMPRMRGIELHAALLAQAPTLAGAIVFTTGDAQRADVVELQRSSGRPVLTKPFDLADLVRAVGAVRHAAP